MRLLWYRNLAMFMHTETDRLENVQYCDIEMQLECLSEGRPINGYWWVIDDVV